MMKKEILQMVGDSNGDEEAKKGSVPADKQAEVLGLMFGIFVVGAMKSSDTIRTKDDEKKRLFLAASDGFFGALVAGLAIAIPALALLPAGLSAISHVLLEKFLKVRDFKSAVTQFQGLLKANVLGWSSTAEKLAERDASRYIFALETALNLNGLP